MTRPRSLRHLVASITCLLGVAILPSSAMAEAMTLRAAVELARQNNERAQAAALAIEIAEGQVESSRGAFLPTLTLGMSGTANVNENSRGENFSGQGTITLRQPLLKPSAIPQYRASKFNLDAAKSGSAGQLLALEYDTARAFLSVIQAQRVLAAAEARLVRATAHLEDAQARVDAELNSSNDATRAKLDVSSARRTVTTSDANLAQARLSLSLLLGVEITENVDEEPALVKSAEVFVGVSADLSQEAKSRRPDLVTLRYQTLAAKASADEPLFRLIPSIDLTMQFQANANPSPTTPWDQESASLTLTWTIFDGAVRYGDKRSRDAQAEQAELNERQLERTIDTSVKTALVAIAAAQKNVQEAKNAVDIAAANSEETEILYKQGLARALELTDANGSLYDAEVAYAEAQLALAQAYLDVRLSLGLGALGGNVLHGPQAQGGMVTP